MDEDLTRVFQAATLTKTFSHDQIDALDFEELAEAVLGAQDMPLRVEGQLVFGLSHMLNDKAANLLSDSSTTDRNVIDAFGYRSIAPVSDEVESQGLGGTGRGYVPTELGTANLMSAIGAHEHEIREDVTFDYDQSVDVQVRDDADPDLSMQAPAVTSEDLLDAGEPQDEVRNAIGDLSFGPDLDIGVGSSSPPPDEGAVTPEEYADDVVVDIAGSSPVSRARSPARKRQKRRQRMAPIDENISMTIPLQAPAGSMRKDVQPELNDEGSPVGAYSGQIKLSEEIEMLLDPEYIRSFMKKRRLAEMGFSLEEAEEDQQTTGLSPYSDAVGDIASPLAAGSPQSLPEGPERPNTQDSQMSIDAPAKVAGDTALARGLIEEALVSSNGNSVKLSDLAHGRRERADAFSELLVLAARGRVNPSQSHPYGDIIIST